MPGPVTFETSDTLLERLLAARREVVFLVGAPITAPERGATLGVPDVAGSGRGPDHRLFPFR